MASGSKGLAWERFEELTKVAFTAEPHADTRFFFKTRVVVTQSTITTTAVKSKSKSKSGSRVQIVARVATQSRTNSRAAAQSITYETSVANNLSRLTRLLRFVMQEVLGPMKPVDGVAVATASSVAEPLSPNVAAASNAPATAKTKKPKKHKTSAKGGTK